MPVKFYLIFFCLQLQWWFGFPLTWFPPAVGARPLLMLRGQKVQPANQLHTRQWQSGRKVLPLASNCAQFQFCLMISVMGVPMIVSVVPTAQWHKLGSNRNVLKWKLGRQLCLAV